MLTPAKLHLSGFWLANYSGRLTRTRRNSWSLDLQSLRKLTNTIKEGFKSMKQLKTKKLHQDLQKLYIYTHATISEKVGK